MAASNICVKNTLSDVIIHHYFTLLFLICIMRHFSSLYDSRFLSLGGQSRTIAHTRDENEEKWKWYFL